MQTCQKYAHTTGLKYALGGLTMKRVTVTLDEKTDDVLTEFAELTGESKSSIVRGLLSTVVPTLNKSVDLYKQAQAAGEESQKIMLNAANTMEQNFLPQTQKFMRDWNALMAQTQDEIDKVSGDETFII